MYKKKKRYNQVTLVFSTFLVKSGQVGRCIYVLQNNGIRHFHGNYCMGVAGFEQAGVLARAQGKQFIPKRCRKDAGATVTALIARTAWFNNAARPGSIQQKSQRTSIQQWLIAGEKKKVTVTISQAKHFIHSPQPKEGTFTLSFLRRGVVNRMYRQSLGKHCYFIIRIDKKNPLKAIHAANQIQTVAGKGFASEWYKQLVFTSKAAGKTRRHQYRKVTHGFRWISV
jgi:hypothetical protein